MFIYCPLEISSSNFEGSSMTRRLFSLGIAAHNRYETYIMKSSITVKGHSGFSGNIPVST